jgi:hypothetical protein
MTIKIMLGQFVICMSSQNLYFLSSTLVVGVNIHLDLINSWNVGGVSSLL